MAGRPEREEDMSDYRRWISYIYAYENGIKKRNAGYAKLELKDGRLTMTLHVTPDGREGNYRVCLYKSQSGRGEGVLLGNVDKKQGGNGVRFVEDAADLNGSGLLFQEMNGLLLYDERGKYLISSWEDEPVQIPVVQEVIALLEQGQVDVRGAAGDEREDRAVTGAAWEAAGQSGETGQSGENAVMETAGGTERGAAGTPSAEGAGSTEQAVAETAEGSVKETARKTWVEALENAKRAAMDSANKPKMEGSRAVQETDGKSAGEADRREGEEVSAAAVEGTTTAAAENEVGATGQDPAVPNSPEEAGANSKTAGMFRTESVEAVTLSADIKNAPESGEAADGLHACTVPASAVGDTWQQEETSGSFSGQDTAKQTGQQDPVAAGGMVSADGSENARESGAAQVLGRLESRIFSCLPAMYPFEHQEFERSVRMEPQDLGLLPREMWKYAGNSFLLHSYYAYHHMLFVRKVRGRERNCFLMLPGVYNPKEQHMAQLFGFSRFCPVRKKALQQGDFGYWYMEVCFPKES